METEGEPDRQRHERYGRRAEAPSQISAQSGPGAALHGGRNLGADIAVPSVKSATEEEGAGQHIMVPEARREETQSPSGRKRAILLAKRLICQMESLEHRRRSRVRVPRRAGAVRRSTPRRSVRDAVGHNGDPGQMPT